MIKLLRTWNNPCDGINVVRIGDDVMFSTISKKLCSLGNPNCIIDEIDVNNRQVTLRVNVKSETPQLFIVEETYLQDNFRFWQQL